MFEACLFDLRVITHKENIKLNLASNIYTVHDYQPSKKNIRVCFEKSDDKKDKVVKCSVVVGHDYRWESVYVKQNK